MNTPQSRNDFEHSRNALLSILEDERLAKEELQRSEKQHRSFFEEDLAGVYSSTPEGRILSCNPAFARMFGFESVEQAMRADVRTFYKNPQSWEEFLEILKRKKRVEYFEMELVRRDGKTIQVVANMVGQFDEGGELVEIKEYLFDDSKRRQLEQQLVQAQKLESLGTLTSGIAHDFNNILGIILGHSSLLASVQPDRAQLSRHTEAIQKATMRGASLVKQLLTFARKTDVVFESVDMNGIINEVATLLSETLSKTIAVSKDLQRTLPFITADATQIHQLLLNLCVNARDAMPNGGTLSIATSTVNSDRVASTFPNASAAQYILLQVADSGTGMDEATKQRIFDPFFTTKGVGKGTGLGLSLVHTIVTNHSGFIDLETEPGKGTRFNIYFPTHEETIGSTKPKEEVQDVAGGTETLLVIEDEEMLRELMKTLLESKGYTVLTAADGEEGVEVFSLHRSSIAVVISDLGLPRLEGKDAMKRILAIEPTARLICASGTIEPGLKAELQTIGVKSCVQKPYLPNEVLRAVRETIDNE